MNCFDIYGGSVPNKDDTQYLVWCVGQIAQCWPSADKRILIENILDFLNWGGGGGLN